MSTNAYVRTGWWYDYDSNFINRQRILVSDRESFWVSNGLAVLFSLIIPSILIVLQRLGLAIWENPSLRALGEEDNALKACWKLLKTTTSPRLPIGDSWESTIKAFFEQLWNALVRLWEEPSHLAVVALAILYLAFAAAFAVAGVFIPNIVLDNTALTNNPKAGLWAANIDEGSDKVQGMVNIDYKKEIAAGQYKSTCYNNDNSTTISCSLFYNRTINHIIIPDVDCPFNGDVCIRPAVRLSTTPLSTNVLGINAQPRDHFFFERNMTCAPLDNSNRYVRQAEWDDELSAWIYNYGSTLYQNHTFENSGDWAYLTASSPGYDVWSTTFIPQNPNNIFVPKPAFRAGNKTITLIFVISNGKTIHATKRDDPIFPADTPTKSPYQSDDSTYWVYESTRAGVLGCVDSYRIWNPSKTLFWDASNASATWFVPPSRCTSHWDWDCSPSNAQRRIFYLTLTALSRSDAFNAINFRGREALDISSRIGTSTTFILPKNQWLVEAENLFMNSLARMQLDLFDFAWGTYADVPGVWDFAAAGMEDAHTMLKFPVTGYKNLSAFWLIFLIVACVLLFLYTRRYSTAQQRSDRISEGSDPGWHDFLWGTIFWVLLGQSLAWLARICVSTYRGIEPSHVVRRVRTFIRYR